MNTTNNHKILVPKRTTTTTQTLTIIIVIALVLLITNLHLHHHQQQKNGQTITTSISLIKVNAKICTEYHYLPPEIATTKQQQLQITKRIFPNHLQSFITLPPQSRSLMSPYILSMDQTQPSSAFTIENMEQRFSLIHKPVSIITLHNVTVWRSQGFETRTFYQAETECIWSYSARCPQIRWNNSKSHLLDLARSSFPAAATTTTSNQIIVQKNKITEAILLSSEIAGTAHYHAMSEKAFLLGVVRDFFPPSSIKHNPPIKIIIDALSPGLESFAKLLEIDSDQQFITTATHNNNNSSMLLQVDILHVILPTGCMQTPTAAIQATRDWIRDKYNTIIKPTNTQMGKILVIDRRDSSRYLTNTKDLIQALETTFPERGKVDIFVATLPGTNQALTMYEQMIRFQDAELVIAPHGAGLVNMIFLRDGSKIIEVFNKKKVVTCYAVMAASLDLFYRGIRPTQVKEVNNNDNTDLFEMPWKFSQDKYDVELVVKTAKELLGFGGWKAGRR
jgi:hypothetical protein